MNTSLGHVMMRGNLPLASRCPLTIASMMLGWSEPRLTKQWVMPASQMASKKAKEAVYISGVVLVEACLLWTSRENWRRGPRAVAGAAGPRCAGPAACACGAVVDIDLGAPALAAAAVAWRFQTAAASPVLRTRMRAMVMASTCKVVMNRLASSPEWANWAIYRRERPGNQR